MGLGVEGLDASVAEDDVADVAVVLTDGHGMQHVPAALGQLLEAGADGLLAVGPDASRPFIGLHARTHGPGTTRPDCAHVGQPVRGLPGGVSVGRARGETGPTTARGPRQRARAVGRALSVERWRRQKLVGRRVPRLRRSDERCRCLRIGRREGEVWEKPPRPGMGVELLLVAPPVDGRRERTGQVRLQASNALILGRATRPPLRRLSTRTDGPGRTSPAHGCQGVLHDLSIGRRPDLLDLCHKRVLDRMSALADLFADLKRHFAGRHPLQ